MFGSVFFIDDQVSDEGDVNGDDVLALVDADGEEYIPNERILGNPIYRVLLTSSPRLNGDRKWMKQHCHYTGQVLVMEPCSLDEVILMGLVLVI